LRETLFADAGIFQASKRKKVELARQWLAEIPEATPNRWVRPWVESAILDAEENFQEALQKVDEAEVAVRKEHPGIVMNKCLALWRDELTTKLNSSRPVPAG
jgi:hypothetical protein